MIKEKSCGAVVYRVSDGVPQFLVEHMALGHTSIPKGHVEGNETEAETAKREILEETNLTVQLDTGFRHVISYSPAAGISKDVVFFVARAEEGKMIQQECEVSSLEWLPLDQAMNAMTYETDRETLRLANAYLHETGAFSAGTWQGELRNEDSSALMKYDVFLSVAAMLNQRFRVIPLLFGSLGLERRLGIPMNPDDIDVLIPEKFLTSNWQLTVTLMAEAGYVLRDEAEHEFAKDAIKIAFASIENLAPFAGIDIQKIPQIRDNGVIYFLPELPDYLKVYEASSRDGYRKNVKHKQDQQKINLILNALQAKETDHA